MDLKSNIKKRRLELGLTLEEVAEKVGITRSTLHKYESGMIVNVPYKKIVKLSMALDTSPTNLMGFDVEEYNIRKEKVEKSIDKIDLFCQWLSAAGLTTTKRKPYADDSSDGIVFALQEKHYFINNEQLVELIDLSTAQIESLIKILGKEVGW